MMPNYNESLRTQIWVCESSVLPEPAEVYYHVNPIFDLPSYLPSTLKTFSTSHTSLAMFSKKGSSKLSLGLSYKSRAVSQFMRCLLDCNFFSKFTNNFKCHARVSKTCRPWRPVSANFLWPVLIFGKSMRKNCAIMSMAHITYTIAH